MNNPLAQKYQYYLNESHRLSEELKSEEVYSELLENVLFELLGEEDFTKLFEYVMKGGLTHDEHGNALSPERSARRAKRIGQIIDIGKNAYEWDKEKKERAADSLRAKGVVDTANRNDTYMSQRSHIAATLGKPLEGSARGRHEEDTTLEVDPSFEAAPYNHSVDDPQRADENQKRASLRRRKGIEEYKAELRAGRDPLAQFYARRAAKK